MMAATETVLSKGPSVRNSPANANPTQLQKLGRDVRTFSFGLYKLRNLKNVPQDMQAEYQSILSKVQAIENTITKTFGGLNTVAKWAGLSGPEILVPLAMYGTIIAGVAYGSKLILDFMRRYDARMIQAGNPEMSYADALEQAGLDNGGIFDSVTDAVKNPLILGGVGLLAILFLLRR